MAYYLDTSALVKLVVRERETASLQEWASQPNLHPVTSDLTRTELMRAVLRAAPTAAAAARSVLEAVDVCAISPRLFDLAGRLHPVGLRSLDAIHLAVALDLGDELRGMVTYDDRLAEAAGSHGLQVVAPGW